jgi:hypothetical protein
MAGGMSASFDGIASDAFASITDDGGGRYSGSGYQGRFDLTYPANDFANTSFNEFMNGATFGGWGWTSVGAFFDMTDAILEGNWGNAAIAAIGIVPGFKGLKKAVGGLVGGSDDVIAVTKAGVALPPGVKYQIPSGYVSNPNRSGSFGQMIDGRFVECLRIDQPTRPGQKGPNYSHYHLDGKRRHFSPRPGDRDPGFVP